jgi:iron complex outermembrane receptor protein
MMTRKNLLLALLIGVAPGALLAQARPAAPQQRPAARHRVPRPAPAPAPAAEEEEADDIIVTGSRRLPGAAIGDIPPEVTLNQGDIRSYGASSVTDLLTQLAPQLGSGQGRGGERPVVLLNGHRISGLREIQDIPTEAIQRVEILPEEVALRYGYNADQKVVNIVLRRYFRATTVEASAGTSTAGGGTSGSGEAGLLRIRRDTRLNLDVKYESSDSLLESQRDILPGIPRRPFAFGGNVTAASGLPGAEVDPLLSALAGQPVTIAGVPDGLPTLAGFAGNANRANSSDVAHYRTLRPATDQLQLNAVLARPIGNVSATFNASFQANGSDALTGVPGVGLIVPAGNPFSPFGSDVALDRYVAGIPLTQHVASEAAHAGLTLLGTLHHWNWSLTGNYDRVATRTRTVTGLGTSGLQAALDAGDPGFDPFGSNLFYLNSPLLIDRAHSLSNAGNVQLVANGTLLDLPAGPLLATFKLGGEATGFATEAERAGVIRTANLSRTGGNGQVTLDLPLASRRHHVLDAIGDLTANLNLAATRLSDFGTITTLGYGLTWKPIPTVTLLWSMTDQQGAPTIQQLGNPNALTPGVPVFDYVTGQTRFVTRLEGGNPALRADERHIFKLGLNANILSNPQLVLNAQYLHIRTDNAIASLPAATAAIEAAFPERFIRDPDGDLAEIDNRPVNFARETRSQLRWGFNLSVPLRASAAQQARLREMFRSAFANRRFPGAPGGEGRRRRDGTGPAPAEGNGAPPQPGTAPAQGGAEAQAQPAVSGSPGAGAGAAGGSGAPEGQGGFGGFGRGGFGGRGGGFGGRSGFGGPGGAGSGRLQLGIYHTWIFRDDILIRPGVPVIDLLNGGAIGASGGQPRHRIEAQGGISKNGFGLRFSANWQSGTVVRGGLPAAGGSGDLSFSDLATANLRLYADFTQIGSLGRQSWARGLRVTFSINNIFDAHERVRDATGATPLSYQPDYLDPLGREVRLTIRKLFF